MDITAGVTGQVMIPGTEEEELDFLLHEYEITVNPLEEDEGKTFDEQPRENHCAYPVHKGVRIYLWQRDSKIPNS